MCVCVCPPTHSQDLKAQLAELEQQSKFDADHMKTLKSSVQQRNSQVNGAGGAPRQAVVLLAGRGAPAGKNSCWQEWASIPDAHSCRQDFLHSCRQHV